MTVGTSVLAASAGPPTLWRRLLGIGPGVVFVMGVMGPKDLVSNSIAGATDGFSVLWVLAVALLARAVILDATARYVLTTGETVLAGCGRLGRWVVMMWLGVTILRHHLFALVRSVLLGTAAHFIFPLPTPHSATIWGLISWSAGFALLYWGRYAWVEKVTKPLAAVMGLCMLAAVVVSPPDPGQLVAGLLHPVFPSVDGQRSALVLAAVISTALGSFGNFRYSAYVHEKGWRSMAHIRSQRMDMLFSLSGMFAMMALIQVAAATVLLPQGIHVKRVEDIVPVFARVAGNSGHVLFGVTLWSILFGSYVGSGSAFGIMISDVYHRFIRPSAQYTEGGKGGGEMPSYRWLVLFLFLSPLYVFFTKWTPVGLVLASGLMSVVTLPIMTVIVLRLTASRKTMGEHANGWLTNVALVLTVCASLYVSWEGLLEVLEDFRAG